MADKLVLNESRGGWTIGWYLSEDGDIGAVLGEQEYSARDLERARTGTANAPDLDTVAAQLAAVAAATPTFRDSINGYVWESKADAQKAFRAAKQAVKNERANKPWPEWAMKAKAEGWTPPKGWQPS